MIINQLIPELYVSNISKSLNFYIKVLNFKLEYQRKESKFAFLYFEGTQIMIEEINPKTKWNVEKLEYPFGRGINFQIQVKNIKKLITRLKNHNYSIKFPLEEKKYRKNKQLIRVRQLLILDPDGYLLRFQQKIKT